MICKCDGSTLVLIRNKSRESEFLVAGNAKVMSYKTEQNLGNFNKITVEFLVNDFNFHKCNSEKEMFSRLGESYDRKSLLKLLHNRMKEDERTHKKKSKRAQSQALVLG